MSVTLDLSPELERRLLAEVERHGSADAAVEAMLPQPVREAKVVSLKEHLADRPLLTGAAREEAEKRAAGFRAWVNREADELDADFAFRRADCYRD